MDEIIFKPRPLPDARHVTTDWTPHFLILLGAYLAALLLVVAFANIPFTANEALLWDAARSGAPLPRPALDMWMASLAARWGMDDASGLRAMYLVAACACVAATWLLSRSIHGPRAAFWAAALFATTPAALHIGTHFGSAAPAVALWSLCLFALRGLAKAADASAWNKWAAILLPTLALAHFASPAFWLFPILAAILLAPRDTPRLRHSLCALALTYAPLVIVVASGPMTLADSLTPWTGKGPATLAVDSPLLRLCTPLAAMSPASALICLALAVSATINWRKIGNDERLLLAFGALPLLASTIAYLLLGKGFGLALLFMPPSLALMAGWGSNKSHDAGRHLWESLQGWIRPGLAISIATSAFYCATPALQRLAMPDDHSPADLAREGYIEELAENIQSTRELMPRKDAPILAITSPEMAALIAFNLDDKPRIEAWPGRDNPGIPPALCGIEALILSGPDTTTLPADLRATLIYSRPVGLFTIDNDHKGKTQYAIYWAGFLEQRKP